MHLQLTTFRLAGPSPADYAEHCDAVAPRFAEIPGLRSKVWIAEPAADVYGGVYLWQDERWAQRYTAGPVYRALLDDARFADVTTTAFDVLDGPTAVTRWGFSTQAA
jgi:Putative mono-oxygenase ydhR